MEYLFSGAILEVLRVSLGKQTGSHVTSIVTELLRVHCGAQGAVGGGRQGLRLAEREEGWEGKRRELEQSLMES